MTTPFSSIKAQFRILQTLLKTLCKLQKCINLQHLQPLQTQTRLQVLQHNNLNKFSVFEIVTPLPQSLQIKSSFSKPFEHLSTTTTIIIFPTKLLV